MIQASGPFGAPQHLRNVFSLVKLHPITHQSIRLVSQVAGRKAPPLEKDDPWLTNQPPRFEKVFPSS